MKMSSSGNYFNLQGSGTELDKLNSDLQVFACISNIVALDIYSFYQLLPQFTAVQCQDINIRDIRPSHNETGKHINILYNQGWSQN